jgi:pseudouridine-5'-phosphate glycosidase
VTPYLLQRIFELTEGKSLKANVALVENNARVAARIAVALAARYPVKAPLSRA